MQFATERKAAVVVITSVGVILGEVNEGKVDGFICGNSVGCDIEGETDIVAVGLSDGVEEGALIGCKEGYGVEG